MKKNDAKRTIKQSAKRGSSNDKPAEPAGADRIRNFLAQRKRSVGVGAGVGVSQANVGEAGTISIEAGGIGNTKSAVAGADVDATGETVGNGRASGSGATGRIDRRRRVSSTGTGTRTGEGTGEGTGTEAGAIKDNEVPARVVIEGKGKKKKTTAETKAEQKFQAAIMVGLLQTFITGGFQSIALFTREPHWQLQTKEAEAVATQLNACLETLPKGTYESFEKLVSRYVPWLGLALTFGAVAGPRIEQSRVNRKTAATGKRDSERARPVEPEWAAANPWQYGGTSPEWSGPRAV